MFTSPGPELFQLGPFALRWYGLLIALAVLIGLNLSSWLARQRDLEQGLISDLLPILVLAAVIGARIYYVAFEWRNYQGAWWEAFAIWRGGIAIHGALLAGTIAVILFCRWRRQSFWDVLDVLVPSVALGQAIGRWGNFFNSEAFGVPTDLPWKLFIAYPQRPAVFADADYFHPTFLYESIWNLLVFALLMTLFLQGRKRRINLPAGALSCVYLLAYSLGRVWIEGLRIDPLCLGGQPPFCDGGLRIAQLMSLALMGLAAVGLWWLYGRKRALPDLGSARRGDPA
ncbi:prolipoprotein diacylglyceryl transferase [Synechococcus sp. BS56D]|jgi:phosphatidylglycerol:prolipoprotein diacylglycerol transferase|uniref:prolipoprotein diacylglyceryl transferase n=1 Tax=Synechococcus sp. BS56D TaxID=2055944 RepID=UPI00103884D0|nr:prolipoprotein diacylglyceryl transferase [Synechococcus sp. BS56D]NDD45867.1 prolipoprotein diacylglyceryl transferase [Synechococcaceae bacterium WB9_4xB_025]TCD59497.1 prolipoprotein diacylglyceryl transferase [Synechococcus sp. BS56D]